MPKFSKILHVRRDKFADGLVAYNLRRFRFRKLSAHLKKGPKMIGGFSTPKKDKALKSSGGKLVKAGEILVRGVDTYKAGVNVRGLGTLFAACPGKVYFTRKKTSHGKLRTFVNVAPIVKAAKK